MTRMMTISMMVLYAGMVIAPVNGYSAPQSDAGITHQSLFHAESDMFSASDATVPSSGKDYPYKGYSSTRQDYGLTKCYKSDYEMVGGITESVHKAQYFSSDKEASESFGFDISGGGSTPTFSASGSLGYSSSSVNRDYTLSYFVGATLMRHVDITINSETKEQLFTDQRLLVLNNNSKNGIATNVFTEKCGDMVFKKVALQENLWVKTYQICINEDILVGSDG